MVGAVIDVRMVVPVEIAEIEIVPLDYHLTRLAKTLVISVDGEEKGRMELPNEPVPTRIPLKAQGQIVTLKVVEEHPLRTDGERTGPPWGGIRNILVWSTTDVETLMSKPDGYDVTPVANAIAPTMGSIVAGEVAVQGQPRQAEGHPRTIWDKQDVAHYRQMLATNPILKSQYESLIRGLEERMTLPHGVPQPQQNEKGEWLHLSGPQYEAAHNKLALDIANFGTAYQLSGDEKYARFAISLLKAYADAHPNYGIGARPGFNHDPSKVFDQRLGDAIWMIQIARGYDFIHDSPSLSAEDRAHIENNLIKASAHHILANRSVISAPTNWSAISMACVMMCGYATDDEELIRIGLYGRQRNVIGDADNVLGGAYLHFGPSCIGPDGLWSEGAMGYQFMALQALIAYAEIGWRNGIDFYRYRDGALKSLFDSPLQIAYPDLRTPALHDSGHGSIIGHDSYLYEFAYLRYQDPRYLLVLDKTAMHISAQYQMFPLSRLYDRDRDAPIPAIEWRSVNFFDVGFGVLRQTDERGTVNLLLDYTPMRSHGHPDRLGIDLWAHGGRIMPDPGSVWYEQPIYRNWYSTTMSHNTLVVDEYSQSSPDPTLLVYAPADTFGMQRAYGAGLYAGVTQDRSLFVCGDYMADIFGVFARVPRQMDLCWHIRGDFETDLNLTDQPFAPPHNPGYSELDNVQRSQTGEGWRATFTRDGQQVRFVASGGSDTEVIVGDGHLQNERPKTIIQRRNIASTLYGNVLEFADQAGKLLRENAPGFVSEVVTSGSLDEGYGLLKLTTAKGIDYCYTSYKPGARSVAGFETDAQQAFIRHKGSVVSAAWLAGGTHLSLKGCELRRSAPGLAYFEQMNDEAWILGNPSPEAAEITLAIELPRGYTVWQIDQEARRQAQLNPRNAAGGGMVLTLPPAARVEIAAPGFAGLFATRQQMLQQRQAELAAAAAKAEAEARERSEARTAAAREKTAPANTVIVTRGLNFSAQGGGEVNPASGRVGASGTVFSSWDAIGHWLEWTIEVPAEGYYNLSLLYCSALQGGERLLAVNGTVPDPEAILRLAATGGWSRATDDWQLHTLADPAADHAFLIHLKEGANQIRLTNISGHGCNLDLLAITSPDVTPERALITGKAPAEKAP